MNQLEGLWQPVYAELDGEEAPRMFLEKLEFELTSGAYTVRFGGEASDHGRYEFDEVSITLRGIKGANAGRTLPSIYKFSGDVLSICYGLGGERPTKFATATGQQLYLVNYRRKDAEMNS